MTETTDVFRREVTVQLREDGDGRTLVAKLVPYNEVATVSDDGMTAYKEEFLPGAFQAQTRAAHRIKVFLNYRHGQSLQDQVGHAVSLEERDDGLYGELRVINHPDGDKALQMIRAGVLDKLSIEFEALRSRTIGGVVRRIKARLRGVALTPQGAYEGAAVLSIREGGKDADGIDNKGTTGVSALIEFPDFDHELATRMDELGLSIPQFLLEYERVAGREQQLMQVIDSQESEPVGEEIDDKTVDGRIIEALNELREAQTFGGTVPADQTIALAALEGIGAQINHRLQTHEEATTLAVVAAIQAVTAELSRPKNRKLRVLRDEQGRISGYEEGEGD